MSTTANNSSVPLAANATFTGLAQLTTGFTNILVSVKVDKKSELTIQQSANKVHWDLDSVWTCDPANDPFGFTIQTPVALPYFRVKLHNITAENMTILRLVSVLNLTSNVKLTPQQDNTLVSGEDADKKKHTLQTTSAGDLIINGTGGSATRNVHYLVVGNYYRVASIGVTSGAEWNAIGAIVDGESEPQIGRLFKCLSIGALFGAGGTCYDVEYTDNITATPVGVQDISGSVHLLPATDPTLTIGKVRMADFYGDPILTTAGNLMVGISNIYTANPLHTILDSGSVSVTGSVAVTNADITSIKTNTARFGLAIGSNYEESVINTFTNLSITGGYLYNLSVYSGGSVGTNFLKVYGVAGATIADTPLLIVPVPAGQSVNLALSGLKALTGISVRATTTWALAGNTSPSNPISCNLTFSPLV